MEVSVFGPLETDLRKILCAIQEYFSQYECNLYMYL